MRGESGISFTGLYICGVISLVMLVLKLSVIETWSWWRVILPVVLIVGFNVTNMVVAFIYLSFAHIPERPDGDEAELLEPHTINVHYVAAMLFFIVFGDNVVRWIDGSETSYWFWLLSGKVEVLAAFGALSVLALFAYWLRLGRVLKASG
jgi:energy-coupling factor transporter transmembrane protein EcfT